MDREHERDVFQQEIQKLEQQLRSPQKLQTGSEQRNREVPTEGSAAMFQGHKRVTMIAEGGRVREELVGAPCSPADSSISISL